jgi:hypothetical protein
MVKTLATDAPVSRGHHRPANIPISSNYCRPFGCHSNRSCSCESAVEMSCGSARRHRPRDMSSACAQGWTYAHYLHPCAAPGHMFPPGGGHVHSSRGAQDMLRAGRQGRACPVEDLESRGAGHVPRQRPGMDICPLCPSLRRAGAYVPSRRGTCPFRAGDMSTQGKGCGTCPLVAGSTGPRFRGLSGSATRNEPQSPGLAGPALEWSR